MCNAIRISDVGRAMRTTKIDSGGSVTLVIADPLCVAGSLVHWLAQSSRGDCYPAVHFFLMLILYLSSSYFPLVFFRKPFQCTPFSDSPWRCCNGFLFTLLSGSCFPPIPKSVGCLIEPESERVRQPGSLHKGNESAGYCCSVCSALIFVVRPGSP